MSLRWGFCLLPPSPKLCKSFSRCWQKGEVPTSETPVRILRRHQNSHFLLKYLDIIWKLHYLLIICSPCFGRRYGRAYGGGLCFPASVTSVTQVTWRSGSDTQDHLPSSSLEICQAPASRCSGQVLPPALWMWPLALPTPVLAIQYLFPYSRYLYYCTILLHCIVLLYTAPVLPRLLVHPPPVDHPDGFVHAEARSELFK